MTAQHNMIHQGDSPTRTYSISESAGRLGVSRSTISREVAAGRLPGFRLRRTVRVSAAAVDALLDTLADIDHIGWLVDLGVLTPTHTGALPAVEVICEYHRRHGNGLGGAA